MNTNQNLYEIWVHNDNMAILKCFAGSATEAVNICRKFQEEGMRVTLMEMFGDHDDQESEISLFETEH